MKTRLIMLLMVCRIVFPAVAATASRAERPEVEIRRVKAVKVSKSWKNLTQTARVEIPSRWLFPDRGQKIQDFFKRDDRIQIYLGYNSRYELKFDGFITRVSPSVPVTLTCEDCMYKLKQTPVKDAGYKNISLKDLLNKIIPASLGITTDVLDTNLGNFTHKNANVALILDKIKETYGLLAYFKGKTLYVGKAYLGATGAEAKKPVCAFHFQKNVRKDSLEYRDADDVKINMVVVVKQKGKDARYEYGPDVDGKQVVEKVANVTEAQAKDIAMAKLRKLKVTGLKGTLSIFGLPLLEPGDIVQLVDGLYPEKNGNYFIDTVETTFDKSGYANTLTLGSQANLS